MKIYIIGLGGIGSALISPLGKFLKYNQIDIEAIYLIDGDTVEENNLSRQNFIITDINRAKSDVMAEYLRLFGQKVISIPRYIVSETDCQFEEGSVIFVGVDNYVTRYLIEQKCKELKNILIIFGGNEYHDGDVNVIFIKNGKLMTPLYSETYPELKERDKFPTDQSCAEASVHAPQLIFANITVANMMLGCFYSFLERMKGGLEQLPIIYNNQFDLRTNAYLGKSI